MTVERKRRILLLASVFIICSAVLILAGMNRETMNPDAFDYYMENSLEESGMSNAVTAIYLRYRMFDTIFEALLLASAVSAVAYFAAEWEKEGGDEND